jgi:hypothetical protein
MPALDSHLIWTNWLNVDGTLRVGSTVSLAPVSISVGRTPTNLVLSWPVDHTGWQLQAQTNSQPLGLTTNWVYIPGSDATNQISVPLNPSNGSVFFRLTYL